MDDSLKHDGIPLYHQLREIFTEKIAGGEWRSGDLIPNELDLCQQYGVSRGPVRQALAMMVQDGLLARRPGRGTQVLAPKIERDLSAFYSFTILIQQLGMQPSMRLLSFETVVASGSIARRLECTPGTDVFKIHRLRLADQRPLILETVYVPAAICPDLNESALYSAPLYDLLTQQYGVYLTHSDQSFEPSVADSYEASVLEIQERMPVLLLQNTTYALGQRPIVYSKAVMRGERIRYSVSMGAHGDERSISLTISGEPQAVS